MKTLNITRSLIVKGHLWSGAKCPRHAYRLAPSQIVATLAQAKSVAGDFESLTGAFIETTTTETQTRKSTLK